MANFTEEQLRELETTFGLIRQETLPVRDGVVARNDKVWWRSANGPEYVSVHAMHWENIKNFPSAYQIAEPKTAITYLD